MAAAALLFLAACAWTGACLCGALGRLPAALPATAEEESAPLRGIAIRRERAVEPVPDAEDGERLSSRGVYFTSCDGYESLTPEAVEDIAAAELEALLAAPPGETGVARLVEDFVWYYAALLPEGAEAPAPGPCRLHFMGFEAGVPARLLRVRRDADGKTLLLFRLTEGGDHLKLRKIEAEIERR